jgi:hypothetical protein
VIALLIGIVGAYYIEDVESTPFIITEIGEDDNLNTSDSLEEPQSTLSSGPSDGENQFIDAVEGPDQHMIEVHFSHFDPI